MACRRARADRGAPPKRSGICRAKTSRRRRSPEPAEGSSFPTTQVEPRRLRDEGFFVASRGQGAGEAAKALRQGHASAGIRLPSSRPVGRLSARPGPSLTAQPVARSGRQDGSSNAVPGSRRCLRPGLRPPALLTPPRKSKPRRLRDELLCCSRETGSNLRPSAPKADALPGCILPDGRQRVRTGVGDHLAPGAGPWYALSAAGLLQDLREQLRISCLDGDDPDCGDRLRRP